MLLAERSNSQSITTVIYALISGNVAYEGEEIQVTASIVNEDGKNDVSRINA